MPRCAVLVRRRLCGPSLWTAWGWVHRHRRPALPTAQRAGQQAQQGGRLGGVGLPGGQGRSPKWQGKGQKRSSGTARLAPRLTGGGLQGRVAGSLCVHLQNHLQNPKHWQRGLERQRQWQRWDLRQRGVAPGQGRSPLLEATLRCPVGPGWQRGSRHVGLTIVTSMVTPAMVLVRGRLLQGLVPGHPPVLLLLRRTGMKPILPPPNHPLVHLGRHLHRRRQAPQWHTLRLLRLLPFLPRLPRRSSRRR